MIRPLDPGSPPRGIGSRVAAGLEEDADAAARLPLEDRVLGHVGEEQKAPAAIPDRPLGPVEPVRHPLDPRVAGDDLIEPGIEPLDRAQGRCFLLLGASRRAGEETTRMPTRRRSVSRHNQSSLDDMLSWLLFSLRNDGQAGTSRSHNALEVSSVAPPGQRSARGQRPRKSRWPRG